MARTGPGMNGPSRACHREENDDEKDLSNLLKKSFVNLFMLNMVYVMQENDDEKDLSKFIEKIFRSPLYMLCTTNMAGAVY